MKMRRLQNKIMSSWADLPEELLHLILSYLFAAKDRRTFGLVCRSWKAIISLVPYHHSPCLMFYETVPRLWKLFQFNGAYSAAFLQLHRAHICCSKYGWLLLRGDYDSLFFFDPFNEQEVHHIPKSDYLYSTIAFFNKPTSSNCFLVGIGNVRHTRWKEVKIGVLNHGDDKWKGYSFYHDIGYKLSLCTPVLHCQLLYTLDNKGHLSSFDVNELGDKSSWIVKTTQASTFDENGRSSKIKHQYLIKLEGEQVLLAVLVKCDVRKVDVYKLDMMKWPEHEEWETVEDLADKVLFVSCNTSFALNATPPFEWMANKIFFPKLHDGYNGVFFSMNTNKYHSYDGNYSSNDPYGIKDLNQFGTWVIPQAMPRFPSELKWFK